ncbi:MAG: D-aminoacyl-tRNA deacylase [Nanoarchaeota archaeon]
MRISCIISQADSASMNIWQHLQQMFPWEAVQLDHPEDRLCILPVQAFQADIGDHRLSAYVYAEESVYLERIDRAFSSDYLIFCTKHQAKSGIPSLSVHTQGNFGTADFGGQARTLAPSPALLLATAYDALKRQAALCELDYDVVYEVTHHGPAVETPSMFIEIGSDARRWQDQQAGAVVASALYQVLADDAFSDHHVFSALPAIIGFGGLHTCPSFVKLVDREQALLGHICPGYRLSDLDEAMVQQMIEKTHPAPVAAVLDWKGLKKEKQRVISLLEKVAIPVYRTKDFSDGKNPLS